MAEMAIYVLFTVHTDDDTNTDDNDDNDDDDDTLIFYSIDCIALKEVLQGCVNPLGCGNFHFC